MKRVVAIGALSAFLLSPLPALANPLDVPADAWYSSVVSDFVNGGYFDETQPFRPTEKATRAEFVQLLVRLQGGVTHAPFTTQSFDDVAPNNPFFNFFEEGGLAGWIKGTGSCYGNHPCTANPNSPINRAEAATLMIRAFKLEMSDQAPSFTDNPPNQWFTVPVNSAASLCILQGDAGGKKVRPSDNMIRAEMATMLKRATQHLNYPNCNAVTDYSLPPLSEHSVHSSSSVANESNVSSAISSSSSSGPSLHPEEAAFHKEIEDNLISWKKFHDDLIERSKEYLKMPAAESGLMQINRIESEYVPLYNQYLQMYNADKSGWLFDNMSDFRAIEVKIDALIKEFEAMPLVYF